MPERHLTIEQFLSLPEEEPALEFEEGRITQKALPTGKHSILQAAMCQAVDRVGIPDKLAMAFLELRTTFAGRSYVPDVAVYRWERIPVDASGQIEDDFVQPPDIAIEILSPEERTTAPVRRCLWYVANGVQVALLVDPADQSILSFRPNQIPRALCGPDPIDFGDVLPGFELTAEALFDALKLR